MQLNDTQVTSLISAAESGVSWDGLTVDVTNEGYDFETPTTSHYDVEKSDVKEVAEEQADYVTNWFYWTQTVNDDNESWTAFLQWLENANELSVPERYERLTEGINQTWGQLLITSKRDTMGKRSYAIRHLADRNTDRESLERYTTPGDARYLAKFDDNDQYRPLKTAPTLQTGWIFHGLLHDELIRTIDFFYPASIANWYREQQGNLDITHWEVAANRQTGMFDVVKKLPPSSLETAVAACCDDSQCLKRRRWEATETESIDGPRGDGEIPCREACSLFISAAREWAIQEQESPESYEFELTPSEKTQLEAIISAVATGQLENVRVGDVTDPANRYRVRYLYENRFKDSEQQNTSTSTNDP